MANQSSKKQQTESNGQPAGEASTPATEESELVQLGGSVIETGARILRAAASPLGPLGATPEPADVSDEVERLGPAFGSFVRAVGLAVAEAQGKLDQTLVTTAKALSDTEIDVIAIYEQQINNDGQMEQGNVVRQKLPLINYLMPTAYQWSRVFLQADMDVQEFNTANGFNIKSKASLFSARASASGGLFSGFSASGSVQRTTFGVEVEGESSFGRDLAAGKMHMEATLEPRADIELPKPLILQKGPQLKVTAGSRRDILSSANPPVTIGREVVLTVELRDRANAPLPNKQIEFRISNPLLNYNVSNNGQTDADGKLTITIERLGAAYDAAKPPEAVIVNVWLGLINQQVVINL